MYTKEFDYVINAVGFESEKIDDDLGYKREIFVEFKAAFVTKWDKIDKNWPKIIFHGTRGTPKGMGQFTPYFGGFVQLHAMTKDITLFNDGLVKTKDSSQPKLPKRYINYIEKNCNKSPESLPKITKEEVDKFASEIAQNREYPKEMGMVNNPY